MVPGRLLVTDWVPPRPERTEGVMFVYDGGTLDELGTADIQLPPDELRSWAWCDQDQIRERMSALLARRVIAALCAKAEGAMFDLENGFTRTDMRRRRAPFAMRVRAALLFTLPRRSGRRLRCRVGSLPPPSATGPVRSVQPPER